MYHIQTFQVDFKTHFFFSKQDFDNIISKWVEKEDVEENDPNLITMTEMLALKDKVSFNFLNFIYRNQNRYKMCHFTQILLAQLYKVVFKLK